MLNFLKKTQQRAQSLHPRACPGDPLVLMVPRISRLSALGACLNRYKTTLVQTVSKSDDLSGHGNSDEWLLIGLGLAVVVLSISIGYQWGPNITKTKHYFEVSDCARGHVGTSLHRIRLPSAIPNFRVAAQRHLFLPVDLRKADLQLSIQTDTALLSEPLLDKVLYVPKKFG